MTAGATGTILTNPLWVVKTRFMVSVTGYLDSGNERNAPHNPTRGLTSPTGPGYPSAIGPSLSHDLGRCSHHLPQRRLSGILQGLASQLVWRVPRCRPVWAVRKGKGNGR
jgi:hypothetical protein